MNRHVLVPLLETTVFTHIVQIVTTNDNGALHFQFLHDSIEDASPNAHISGERAFVVDVCTIDCLKNIVQISFLVYRFSQNSSLYLFRSFESQSNFAVMTSAKFTLSGNIFAANHRNGQLLLESTFCLNI